MLNRIVIILTEKVNHSENEVVGRFSVHRRIIEGGLFILAFQQIDRIRRSVGSPVRSIDNVMS